jgi:N-acylneuraminate cytidylyltransferase
MAKAVAIIPARGGSKRIPRKNIKDFHGRPLIAYSIQTALESKLFDRVIVTTDDAEIAAVAEKYGAEVPFIRPKELADDFSGTQDVIDHALKWLQEHGEHYDFACTIYATAPLLQSKYLIEGYNALKNSTAVNAFSATSMPFPIQRTFKINSDGRCEMFWPEYYMTRSQDLEEAYQDAGQFYWSKQGQKSDEVMFGEDSIPIILPRHLVQDIDTLEDWNRAEYMYKSINQNIFDKWNSVKQKINQKEPIPFKQGEIYFMSVGHNIGSEIYGHDKLFLRPVLIYRKLSRYSFVGIPLTSKQKDGSYYFTFRYTKKILSTALLNQIRVFDIRRSAYISGNIKLSDLKALESKVEKFIKITPNSKRKGSGHSSKKLPKNLSREIKDSITQEEKNVK